MERVQPTASLVSIARDARAFIVEVNPVETTLTILTDISFQEAAGELIPELLNGGND